MVPKPKAGVKEPTLDLPPLSRGIIEHSPLPMAAVEGMKHIVRYVSPAFCHFVGKKREQLIGYPSADAVRGGKEIALFDRVYRTGIAEASGEQEHSGPNPVYWSYAVWAVFGAGERPVGLIIQVTDTTEAALFRGQVTAINQELLLGSVRQHELTEAAEGLNAGLQREITERKRAEEVLADRTLQLERLNRELVALNAELDDFTNVASHDLQEPLRTLTAFSDLLRKDLGQSLPERAARDLGFITDAAKRMQTLIHDLLALARAGRVAIKREKVSLSKCADRALEALAMRVKESGAQVMREELPDVWGDSRLLTELYQNLIGNALKFSADRRPIIRLTVEEREGDQVFGVKDHGIGIEPKYAQQIFQPFRRLQGRAEYEGSGIGLAICRKIVDRHGGKIWVESEPGKGAHFRFTFSHRTKER